MAVSSIETDVPQRVDEAMIARLTQITHRLDQIAQDGHETRERLERLDARLEEAGRQQRQTAEEVERRSDERIRARVSEAVKSVVQPEISLLRPPVEAQAARLAAVEARLERVETIQVESMNALDVRFGDLGFQTRVALAGGGLISLGAIMVVLLR